MIRHVVTFKFRAEHAEQRAAAASQLRATLEPLASLVPGVQSLEIGIDEGSIEGHWDAVLISLHDSVEALAAYQVHPQHVTALSVVAGLVESKSVVDYTIRDPTAEPAQ